MNIHSVSVTREATGTDPAPAISPMTARILDAALAVLTERTYGETAVPLVAERAGIGVGTIYRSFSGKQALANAVFLRAKSAMLDHLAEGLSTLGPDATTRDTVTAVWGGLGAYAIADPDGFAFLEHQQHAGYLDDESVALTHRIDALAEGLLREGQARGEIRDGDPAVLVALVFGAFVGLGKHLRAQGRALTVHDVADSGDAVWNLLARPTPTPEDPT